MNMNTVTIPCRGGLNLSANNQELLSRGNEAIRLTNFECSKEGGYRRISGYEKIGNSPTGSGRVLGVLGYQRDILSARGSTLQISEDSSGTNWKPISFQSPSKDTQDYSTFDNNPVVTLDTDGRYMFDKWSQGGQEYVFGVNGKNDPFIFHRDSSGNYRFRPITLNSDLTGAKYLTFVKDQLIIAGMNNDPNSIYCSSFATTDLNDPGDVDFAVPQEKFDGATSKSISVGEEITGIKMHRETLYVFCANSIWRVNDVGGDNTVVQPVTRDIGCVDGFTVQEVGGDLLFLAPDGIRTIAQTERNNDLELGVISRKVSPLLDIRLRNADRYQFNAIVIREKNQYRLWYTDLTNPDLAQRGLIAAYTYDSTNGTLSWNYSELESLGVTCLDNSFYLGKERILHGNLSGDVNEMEKGHTFNGRTIPFLYQSPFVDMGDISLRKNIHKVFIMTKPEGEVQLGLELRYDYESSDVHQPAIYPMEQISSPFIWGDPTTIWGDVTIKWGATDLPRRDIYTEGSGKVVSFRIKSLGLIQDYPFDIQSLQVDLTTGGKV